MEIAKAGGPEVLRMVERPRPVPGAGEVLIAVRAAGVSRADALQRQGSYPPPAGAPDIPGLEVAGVVEGTQERVCALVSGGGYAEFVAVPREQILPVPENWSDVEAATLPENLFTVYDNLFTRAGFRSGNRVLIHGGSSGIGTTAIMLAKASGASFIATTAGSDEKCAACRELGADLAINYRRDDFVSAVRDATNGEGVDVVLDLVGGDYIARDLTVLSADGRVACIATQGGRNAQIDLGLMLQRRLTVMGSSLRARTPQQKERIRDALAQHVWPLLPKRDPIRPIIDSTFPLERAADAHRRLESSEHVGKIVLTV
jgi:NADPH2:quinone reductase